jgi:hypothetical protein
LNEGPAGGEGINFKTMIKFFGKKRYNLMGTGKTGKYFKYAIGEILLVMIGILLALQVSNWNQNRLNLLNQSNRLYDSVL